MCVKIRKTNNNFIHSSMLWIIRRAPTAGEINWHHLAPSLHRRKYLVDVCGGTTQTWCHASLHAEAHPMHPKLLSNGVCRLSWKHMQGQKLPLFRYPSCNQQQEKILNAAMPYLVDLARHPFSVVILGHLEIHELTGGVGFYRFMRYTSAAIL